MSLKVNHIDTMIMLMKSTGQYVYKRIGTESARESYRLGMKYSIECASSGIENLDMIKTKIKGLRDEVPTLFPKKMFSNKENEIKFYLTAIEQALEIIESIEGRFITGQYDKELKAFRGKGVTYYEDESLF